MKKLKKIQEESLINDIVRWESGELSEIETIRLFSALVKTRMVWKLQGCYGRNAMSLINNEIIDKKGNILVDLNGYF